MATKRVKAVAYYRVSGASQLAGDGFPRQVQTCHAYARSHGLELVGEYRDEACSGCGDLDAREGFGELVERIAGNGVRVVLVERHDRLARDLGVSEALLATLRQLGCKVIEACSDTDLTDTSDPSRIAFRQLLGVISEFNRRELVAKLAKSRKRIRESTGRCEGRKPYGWAAGEQEGLQRLLELHGQRTRTGLSLRAVAMQLNREGVQTRSGRPWSAWSVDQIARRSACHLSARPKRKRAKRAKP
jgi:DNA invertase Pin-like site-specific DNA recombinase